jgi:hypothetical protein
MIGGGDRTDPGRRVKWMRARVRPGHGLPMSLNALARCSLCREPRAARKAATSSASLMTPSASASPASTARRLLSSGSSAQCSRHQPHAIRRLLRAPPHEARCGGNTKEPTKAPESTHASRCSSVIKPRRRTSGLPSSTLSNSPNSLWSFLPRPRLPIPLLLRIRTTQLSSGLAPNGFMPQRAVMAGPSGAANGSTLHV